MRARYTVTEALGGASVFRGVAELVDGSKRDVAIMRLFPKELGKNKQFVAMFLDDARASLVLKHANIVEVLDIAKTQDAYFLVTEYVAGCNLNALERLSTPHVLHVSIGCCKALTYAHSLGVIHGSVTPRVLLVSNTGEVKLAQFGLPRADTPFEEPGGTFGYLSPEAAAATRTDHRADIFAVGIVLWELLAARRLFVGASDYATVELVRAARFVPIDGLDPALDTIVRKALARDASERYQTASDFGDALTHYAISNAIKLAPGDIASRVRGARVERSSDPRVLGGIEAEVRQMSSIIETSRWN